MDAAQQPTATVSHLAGRVAERLRATGEAYSPDEVRPLRGYVAAMGAYTGLVATVALAARTKRIDASRIGAGDIALLGMATHKLSRTLAKDAVTSPLRAPFTRYDEPGAPAELNEEVREHGGLKHTIGELIICPFCLAQWVATGLMAGHLFAPRATRAVTATMAAVAISDFLQFGYAAAQKAE